MTSNRLAHEKGPDAAPTAIEAKEHANPTITKENEVTDRQPTRTVRGAVENLFRALADGDLNEGELTHTDPDGPLYVSPVAAEWTPVDYFVGGAPRIGQETRFINVFDRAGNAVYDAGVREPLIDELIQRHGGGIVLRENVATVQDGHVIHFAGVRYVAAERLVDGAREFEVTTLDEKAARAALEKTEGEAFLESSGILAAAPTWATLSEYDTFVTSRGRYGDGRHYDRAADPDAYCEAVLNRFDYSEAGDLEIGDIGVRLLIDDSFPIDVEKVTVDKLLRIAEAVSGAAHKLDEIQRSEQLLAEDRAVGGEVIA